MVLSISLIYREIREVLPPKGVHSLVEETGWYLNSTEAQTMSEEEQEEAMALKGALPYHSDPNLWNRWWGDILELPRSREWGTGSFLIHIYAPWSLSALGSLGISL